MKQGIETFGSEQLLQLKTIGHINTEEFEVEGIMIFYSKVDIVLFDI